jgi:hypothetical protein
MTAGAPRGAAVPEWVETGIHGVPRPREWDTVVTAHAPGSRGREAQFVVLPDGGLHVERGDTVEELAAAASGAFEAPFRAEAVRGEGDRWSIGIRRIEVADVPDVVGGELLLVVRGGERSLVLDGVPTNAPIPAIDALAPGGDVVVEAVRLRDSMWEVRVAPL